MARSLLNVPTSDDPVPFLTLPIKVLERRIGSPAGLLTELFSLAANYDDYHSEYLKVIDRSQERLSGGTLKDINRLNDLVTITSGFIAKSFYVTQDPDLASLGELVVQIEEALNVLQILPAMMGVKLDTQGYVVTGSASYTVRQGDTLESIALSILGSPEHWVDIARFNDLDLSIVGATTPIDLWIGKHLLIPNSLGSNLALERDPAVFDAPIGITALGTNLPLTLLPRQRPDTMGLEPGTVTIGADRLTLTFSQDVSEIYNSGSWIKISGSSNNNNGVYQILTAASPTSYVLAAAVAGSPESGLSHSRMSTDLAVLNYTNTVLEGLGTRLETVVGTLPDAPTFGSYIPTLLGYDYGDMTDRILESHIVASLKQDPRVKDVLNFSLNRAADSLQAFFEVRLFNGLTYEELYIGYTLTGA